MNNVITSGKIHEVNLTVKQAAELMGVCQQFIRVGLQCGILPFGYAIKMSSKWTYHISKHKLYAYLGISESGEKKG